MKCTSHISEMHDELFFFGLITKIMEAFMDDFNVHGDSFDECLHHLKLVHRRCIETNFLVEF